MEEEEDVRKEPFQMKVLEEEMLSDEALTEEEAVVDGIRFWKKNRH